MIEQNKILIGLGNEIKNKIVSNFKKGDISRMYLDFLNDKYKYDTWIYLSNIKSYICEKNNIILVKPINQINKQSGITIKNILNYLKCEDANNVCIIIPDIYRPIGKYKYKEYIKIHEKLGSDFYNLLNIDILKNLNNKNYLQLCFGTNNLQNEKIMSVHSNFQEDIKENEHKLLLNTFKLADEYFNKIILNSNYISTNYIHFKKKYPAMEQQKNFKINTSKRRYILDIYKHIYK
ncbi:conserved Plasmodium protein, unknown function [Plasmodium berghei]|uniref:Uncharacterized protein n=2 Tax=Plasmodium berghei TaxID=5821 RepID=A0A509AJA9_PLABA|nr:conserved Plasmodium protein, unknown function [Plasmodium berghei ANKA]CXH83109.1 conserved Plasmodium protein, unknown function [Plasmodium berghei]SCM19254.1 conserved Plasmodium protein, unknown function [Plasmodium berghei]SCN21687.1 conserved Plasmodium protein, unknown function [Plasmodium berghei]SCO58919.1 conserved Plasmodium protein, unknown function [Plasmodium berghei]SCO58976.1 conserved Plasmodium protein, unknown function [Plasmodium berghei]|eukprot:XP_034419707.1 conserved Plasmodium protein, unknown function [Plasmodium berghei ANKA]